MIDLSALNLKELKKLARDVDKAITTSEARHRKEARAAVEKVAKEFGVPVEELIKSETPKPKREKRAPKAKKSTPKFRNPADPKQTWTGKGRRPAWYIAAIDAGKSEADLAV